MTKLDRFIEDQRLAAVKLCEVIGVDPAQVITVHQSSDRPSKVFITVYDGPTPEDRHVEEHDLPEGWFGLGS